MWQAQVFTLYPETFPGPLSKGLYGKALEKKKWNLKVVNIRDSAEDKHKTVDDAPFGGGAGMLLKADILAKSIDNNLKDKSRIFYLSPKGKKFDQKFAKELAKEKSINLICGNFEGVDERILSTRNLQETNTTTDKRYHIHNAVTESDTLIYEAIKIDIAIKVMP